MSRIPSNAYLNRLFIPPVFVSEINTEEELPKVVEKYRIGGEENEVGQRENSVGLSSSSNYNIDNAVMLIRIA